MDDGKGKLKKAPIEAAEEVLGERLDNLDTRPTNLIRPTIKPTYPIMHKNPTWSARSTYIVLQFVGPTSAVLDRQSREHVFGHF